MDVIARTAFGIETDTQKNPNSPFVVNANKLFNANFARPVLIVYCKYTLKDRFNVYLGYAEN